LRMEDGERSIVTGPRTVVGFPFSIVS
jgi:hypothetical protein